MILMWQIIQMLLTLAAERRRMPWMEVEKKYEFDGPKGKVGLLDLFECRRQLAGDNGGEEG
jgi:predicted dithiol-disulfide oxidoreductase (DUF899 family)